MQRELSKCEKSKKMEPPNCTLYYLKDIKLNWSWKNIFDSDADDNQSSSDTDIKFPSGSDEKIVHRKQYSDVTLSLPSSSGKDESSDLSFISDIDYFKFTDQLEPLVLSDTFDLDISNITEIADPPVYADPRVVALDHNYCGVPRRKRNRSVDYLLPTNKVRKNEFKELKKPSQIHNLVKKEKMSPYNSFDIKYDRKNIRNTELDYKTSFSSSGEKFSGGNDGKNSNSNGNSNRSISSEIDQWLNSSTLSDEEIYASSVYQDLLALANGYDIIKIFSEDSQNTVYADPRIVALDHDYCRVEDPKKKS